MLTIQSAYDLLDKLTQASKFYATFFIEYQTSGLTRYANSEIHQNVVGEDCKVTITVFDGEKIAKASTNVLSLDALIQTLNSAELKLPLLQPSGMVFDELKNMPAIEVEGYDPEFDRLWGITDRALAIKAAAESLDEGYTLAGTFEVTHMAMVWGNTHGVRRYQSKSYASIETMVSNQEGGSGFNDVLVVDPKVLDYQAIVAFARDKAALGKNPQALEPGTYDVVLEPLAVNDLVSFTTYLGANSKMHLDKVSPFTGKVDKAVAAPCISLIDDASHPMIKGFAFDFEGYPNQVLPVVEDGIFKGIAHDSQTAKLMGAKPTGHSVGYSGDGGYPLNVVMAEGQDSLETLIQGVERGLLVSRFHYMNVVDPIKGQLTALTRDGLFLIEKGKVTQPVYNLRFTDEIERIFKHVDGLTADRLVGKSFFGANLIPGIRVRDFKFTGKTTID